MYLALCLGAFASCSSLFYHPSRVLHFPPEKFGASPEEVNFRSGDGTHLFGWLFRHNATSRNSAPKGVLLFYHGNAENLSSHYLSLLWLLKHGYDFFIFDYRGYGRSDGNPDPKGTKEDGEAALRWLRARYPAAPIVLYGQSLGGMVALRNAIDVKDETGIRAVVVHGGFASYQEVGRKVMARGILTWPLQWLPWVVLSDRHAPDDGVVEVAPLPLLVMHSEDDRVVPFSCGERIYDLAGEPKEIWKIPGEGHTDAFQRYGDTYQKMLVDWLERNASNSKKR